MKAGIVFIFLFLSLCSFAQTYIKAHVKDAGTKEPLAYCNVSVQGKSKGTITNADGVFSISADIEKDVLVFSYLGYETQVIPARLLLNKSEILLLQQGLALQEVTIHAGDEYLYDILLKCKKSMLRNDPEAVSKVYYGLETEIGEQPAELLECYYNGFLKGQRIIDLFLKNGRIGLSVLDNRIYRNLETSNAIRRLNLFVNNCYFPLIPTQLNKKDMIKDFDLNLVYSDSSIINIAFTPKQYKNSIFSGEIWIDKETMLLLKVKLHVADAKIHPFESVVEDRIDSVNMDIIQSFRITEEGAFPDYIVFDYSLRYHSVTGGALTFSNKSLEEPARITHSKAVLYFYDYESTFILPYFDYDSWIGDYAKLSLIPYNKIFWDNNSAMLLTDGQKAKIGFFADNGYQLNFTEGNYGRDFLRKVTEQIVVDSSFWFYGYDNTYLGQFTFWQPGRRVFIDKTMPQNKTATQAEISAYTTDQLCKIKIQILLDVNQYGDSVLCNSYTVFDEANSFYRLMVKDYTNSFVNIYFDICEIERRKMQEQLDMKNLTLKQIDSLYYKTKEDMEILTYKYMYDVDFGKKVSEMNKWNKYVIENLQIDNVKIFEDYYQKRQERNDSIIKAGGIPPGNIFE